MPQPSNGLPPMYVAMPNCEIPLDNFKHQDEEAQVIPEDPSLPPCKISWTSTISAILAFLIGCAIIAGCIYPLSQSIQHNIEEKYAGMIQYPRQYISMAQTQAYDVCYSGCEFCESAKYAQRACARTAEVNVPGVVCDANKLRDAENRYPTVCLEAVAEGYKKDLFRKARRDYEAEFAFIILIVPFGIFVGGITYGLLNCCIMRFHNPRE
ncbi:hypothetical protein V492_04486 [Pseudogymnoascus sp. VKM F-4246]|nr:hypothetical protein V492_04486 [Pseudogymnoascus sp. VKM F-4246]